MAGEAIFIGYRRDDTADVAGRIYDAMALRFGKTRIFKDVDNIGPGVHFGDYIKTIIPRCRVALVLIGPHWLDSKDESGRRRIDDDHDWVRIEIETVLATSDTLVVPVLVNGARMPRGDELPESIRPLLHRNAAVIRRDPDFHDDVGRLATALRASVNTGILDLSKIGGQSSSTGNAPRAWNSPSRPLTMISAVLALLAVGYGAWRFLPGALAPPTAEQAVEDADEATASPSSRETSRSRFAPLPSGHYRVDFSAGSNASPDRYVIAAEPFLRQGPVAVTVQSRVPSNSVIVFQNNAGAYAGRALTPTTGSDNFLTQIDTGNQAASFTLRFSRPLASVSFVVPALYAATESGVTFPAWRATAFDARGETLDRIEDQLRGSWDDVDAQRHTLRAPTSSAGIVTLQFASDPRVNGVPFAAFSAIMIEELVLEPRSE